MTRLAVPMLVAVGLSAAGAQWRPASGPAGVRLQSIAARGSDIFAGDEKQKAYRSRDEGRTWKAMPLDADLETFTLCGDVLLAGTSLGIRRLAPGDSVFKRSSSGITESFRVVAAAQGRYAFAGGDWGIYRSADQGVTWSPSTQGLVDSIFHLAADSVEIVAAARNGHVYLSRDSGATWNRGLSLPSYFTDLVRCQGRTFATWDRMVLRLVPDGSRWDTVFTFAQGYYTGRIFPVGPELFAFGGDGLYRSADLGAAWTRVSRVFGERVWLTGLAEQGAFLFASTTAGLFRSPDHGATWIGLNNGLAIGPSQHALAFQGDTLFAVGAGLLRLSTDAGATWSTRDSASGRIVPTALAAEPGHLFAGTTEHGVLRSWDGGKTWNPSGTGIPGQKSIDQLFLGGKTLFAFMRPGMLYRSADLGDSWQPAQAGLGTSRLADPQTLHALGDTLFLGTTAGVYRSQDGGASWQKPGGSGKQDYDVTLLANQGKVLYAFVREAAWDSIQGGLYVSRDLGSEWTRIPMRGLPDTVLSDLAAYGALLFAASDSGLYRSSDSGLTWAPMNEGLPGPVAYHPALWIQGASLYANVDGLWLRPLSDFGPLALVGGGVRQWIRMRTRPGLIRQGGRIFVSVPGLEGKEPSRFDLRGQARP